MLTARADFEPHFTREGAPLAADWTPSARFVATPMTQDELRQVIEGPGAQRALVFEPGTLVDRLINEVVEMPGALPLLSFTLSELYIRYLGHVEQHDALGQNRALSETDYTDLGGVIGSITRRANEEHDKLDVAHKATLQRVMLRMVSTEGGERARRRVLSSELKYSDQAENERVAAVVDQFSQARLLVTGQDETGQSYVEPAHDALVQSWDRLWEWTQKAHDVLPLQRRVAQAAVDWDADRRPGGRLWTDNPNLPRLDAIERSPESWLNATETAFVQASVARKRRNRRIAQVVGTALLVFAIVASAAALIALQQRAVAVANAAEAQRQKVVADQNAAEAQRQQGIAEDQRNQAQQQQKIAEEQRSIADEQRKQAEEQARISLSRQLAAQSASEMERQPDLGLLLANEAYAAANTTEGRGAPLFALQRTLRLQSMLWGHSSYVSSVAFSPDGTTLASGSADQTIILWDVSDVQQPHALGQPLQGHSDRVLSVAFSPDGTTLASGSYDKTIMLWDVSDPQQPRALGQPLKGHSSYVSSVAFSPDGTTLASGSEDTTIRLWDVSNPQQPRPLGQPLKGHKDSVLSVAFSPDGKTLGSGIKDSTIVLWDVSNSQPRPLGQPLQGHSADVKSVAFSRGGKTLASGSEDTTIILWDVDVQSWLARTCRSVNRNLSKAEWDQYIGAATPYHKTCSDLPVEGAPGS